MLTAPPPPRTRSAPRPAPACRQDERPPPVEPEAEAAGSPAEWERKRLENLERVARRVEAHRRRWIAFPGRRRPDHPQGRRRKVWCVELARAFPSLSVAASFVRCHAPGGRQTAHSIWQAITYPCACGGLHWVYFDPARHGPPAAKAVHPR